MENVLVVVRMGSAHRAQVNALRLEYGGGGPRRSSAGRGFGQGTWSACYTGDAGPVQTAIRSTLGWRQDDKSARVREKGGGPERYHLQEREG